MFEDELSPYFAWVLRIYDEALKAASPLYLTTLKTKPPLPRTEVSLAHSSED